MPNWLATEWSPEREAALKAQRETERANEVAAAQGELAKMNAEYYDWAENHQGSGISNRAMSPAAAYAAAQNVTQSKNENDTGGDESDLNSSDGEVTPEEVAAARAALLSDTPPQPETTDNNNSEDTQPPQEQSVNYTNDSSDESYVEQEQPQQEQAAPTAPTPTPAPAQQSASRNQGTDVVNKALALGAQQEAQRFTQNAYAKKLEQGLLGNMLSQAQQPTQPMNNLERRAAEQLIGYKQNYNDYQQKYQQALANGDEETAAAYQQGMNDVAAAATNFRQQVAQAGLNLNGAFGANSSLDSARNAYATDTMAGLNSVFGRNAISSEQYYAQQYDALRNAGFSDADSKREAARRAGTYRLERISNLDNAFSNYGLNADGSMNGYGARIISAMGQEDANKASALHALYPGLLDVWKNNNEIAKAQALTDKAYGIENLRQLRQDARTDATNAVRMAIAQMRGSNGGGGNSLNNAVIASMLEQGRTPEQIYAFMHPNKTRDGGNESNEPKLSAADKRKMQGVHNLLVEAQTAVESGNAEASGDAIEEAREAVKDAAKNGYLDPDDIAYANLILDGLVNRRDVLAGYKPQY